MTGYSYADVVERLFREFGDRLPLTTVVQVVHECRLQLSGVAESAMSEMLERLARQRLNSIPQPTLATSPGEVSAPVDDPLAADCTRPDPDARGAGVASTKFAANR